MIPNLHIYGDHLDILVENNDCNLHIYGTHNDVVVEKGEAVTYGSRMDIMETQQFTLMPLRRFSGDIKKKTN